jgi:nitrogen fixation protein NifQ
MNRMNHAQCTTLTLSSLEPISVSTLALADVISMAGERPAPCNLPRAGLDRATMQSLMARHFPSIDAAPAVEVTPVSLSARDEVDKFHDLVTLLGTHDSIDNDESRWLAHAIATGTMGSNHLWEDMGLPSRAVLSQLTEHHFTGTFIRNVGDMRWKKFFYRQLCGECVDYHVCYGAEEIVKPGLFRIGQGHAHR